MLILAFWLTTASPLPCDGLAKTIAMGTLAERRAMLMSVTADTAAVVRACRQQFMRAFANPLRKTLPKPPTVVWDIETRWLGALLRTIPAKDAAKWQDVADFEAVPEEDLAQLVRLWMLPTTQNVAVVFSAMRAISSREHRDTALFEIAPSLVQFEALSPTATTTLHGLLASVGARALTESAEVAVLWQLRPRPIPQDATVAATRLAAGDWLGAFEAYRMAARQNAAYLLHTAALADRLFALGALEPLTLSSLKIAYQKCDDHYKTVWTFGALWNLHAHSDPAVRAEVARQAARRCQTEDRDWPEILEAEATFARAHPDSASTKLASLLLLEDATVHMERLRQQGRTHEAWQLREALLQRLGLPQSYHFLGGPSRARTLRTRLER